MTAATETAPALLLRAADRLDELAVAATPGPWKCGGIGDFGWSVRMGPTAVETEDSRQGKADAAYIAAVDPLAGRAFASILRAAANDAEACDRQNARDPFNDGKTRVMYHPMTGAAMVAARKILGEA